MEWTIIRNGRTGEGIIPLAIAEDGDSHVCTIAGGTESERRARLIACAPELLDVVKQYMTAETSLELFDADKKARAIIAKAEGKEAKP